jgi:hypothetical protein
MSKFKLIMQAGVSISVLGFCMLQLLSNPKSEALYWGGITSTLAYWLPSPSDKDDK